MYDTPIEEAHTGLPHDLPPTAGNQTYLVVSGNGWRGGMLVEEDQ